MISVIAVFEKQSLIHLNVTGHGGLEYGKDVVCAGVSSCVIGALNALCNAENYSLIIKSGYVNLIQVNPSTEHDKVVLETLVVQLETIREAFPNRIKMKVSRKEGNK